MRRVCEDTLAGGRERGHDGCCRLERDAQARSPTTVSARRTPAGQIHPSRSPCCKCFTQRLPARRRRQRLFREQQPSHPPRHLHRWCARSRRSNQQRLPVCPNTGGRHCSSCRTRRPRVLGEALRAHDHDGAITSTRETTSRYGSLRGPGCHPTTSTRAIQTVERASSNQPHCPL
jgi:hypothetical protein